MISKRVFTTSLYFENFNLFASTRFSLIFYSRTSHSTCFPTARDDLLKRQRHPQHSVCLPYHYMVEYITIITRFWTNNPKGTEVNFILATTIDGGKKTTLLMLAGKGKIPVLTESQQVFRKCLVTLKRYLIFQSILDTLDLPLFPLGLSQNNLVKWEWTFYIIPMVNA